MVAPPVAACVASPRSRANRTSVTACDRGRLPTCVTRIRSLLACNAAPSAIHVVRAVIAAEPALELAVRVAAARRVDLLDVGMVDGELDNHPVGVDRVQRAAI